MMTKEELIAFEDEIARLFNDGKIRSPIHLDGGCEESLIEIFKDVKPNDWAFSTHRSHLICLLKGVPPERIKKEILANHSINLNFHDYRVFSSAIVGGVCPIAVGVAAALKRQGSTDKVWCFIGDSASCTGLFYESARYASWHDLPLEFVICDNGLSVNTPTVETWGTYPEKRNITHFSYTRKWPHSGTGEFIRF